MNKNLYYAVIHWGTLIVLMFGFILSLFASHFTEEIINHNKQLLLNKELEKFVKIIDLKINTYQTILKDIRAMYVAHQIQHELTPFTPKQFDQYITSIQANDNLHSLKTVVFYRKVYPQFAEDYIQLIRKKFSLYDEYYQQYRIFPKSNREIILPVELVAPFDTNKGAIGYDVFFEQNRNQSIEYAIEHDFGISNKVILVHTKEDSVLLFVPVYKTIELFKNNESKKDRLIGVIGSAFNVKQFFNDVINDSIFASVGMIRVTDKHSSTNDVLYQHSEFSSKFENLSNNDYLYAISDYKVGGKIWQVELLIHAHNSILFDKLYHYGPKFVFIGGLILTLIIFILQIRNRQLYESDSRFRRLTRISPLAMAVTELVTDKVVLFNKKASELFKCTDEEIKKINPSLFYCDINQREFLINEIHNHRDIQNIEIKFKRLDHSEFWALCSATLTHFEGKKAIIISFVDITTRKELEHKLFELATTDSLTGIFNRRHFLETCRHLINESYEKKQSISLIMLDIDHFKRVNDTYGHDSGDIVICGVANIVKQYLHKNEAFGRLGGEEFAVILPNYNPEDAYQFAELLRHSINQFVFNFPNIGAKDIHVSISLGLVTLEAKTIHDHDVSMPFITIERLITKADEALYQAKHNGRNQVKINTLDE